MLNIPHTVALVSSITVPSSYCASVIPSFLYWSRCLLSLALRSSLRDTEGGWFVKKGLGVAGAVISKAICAGTIGQVLRG